MQEYSEVFTVDRLISDTVCVFVWGTISTFSFRIKVWARRVLKIISLHRVMVHNILD